MMNDAFAYISSILSLSTTFVISAWLSNSRAFGSLVLEERRIITIDGARGYLAQFVFLSHYVTAYYWRQSGVWGDDQLPLLGSGASVGVAVFFMITAFLFVGKILGPQSVDWTGLYISRVFRIYPAYAVAITIVFVAAFALSHHGIGARALVSAVLRWTFFVGGSIGEVENPKVVIAGVHWTLRYELVFYLSLPAIAFVLRRSTRLALSLVAAVVLISAIQLHVSKISSLYLYNFAAGGLIAYLHHRGVEPSRVLSPMAGSLLSLGLLVMAFASFRHPFLQQMIVSAVFYRIATGEDLFGLLRHRSSLLLGDVSYSIYLFHGIVIYSLFSVLFPMFAVTYTASVYLCVMPVVAALLVVVALLSYKWIERPGIAFGHRLRRNVQADQMRMSRANPGSASLTIDP